MSGRGLCSRPDICAPKPHLRWVPRSTPPPCVPMRSCLRCVGGQLDRACLSSTSLFRRRFNENSERDVLRHDVILFGVEPPSQTFTGGLPPLESRRRPGLDGSASAMRHLIASRAHCKRHNMAAPWRRRPRTPSCPSAEGSPQNGGFPFRGNDFGGNPQEGGKQCFPVRGHTQIKTPPKWAAFA